MSRKKQGDKTRHHYVPIFYLKHFRETKENKYLFSQIISSAKIFGPATPDEIAVENHFYTIKGDASYEDELSDLESRWSTIHKKLVYNKSPDILTKTERRKYAEFLAFQITRTRKFRDSLTSILKVKFADYISENLTVDSRSEVKRYTAKILDKMNSVDIEESVDEQINNGDLSTVGTSRDEIVSNMKKGAAILKSTLSNWGQDGVLPRGFRPNDKAVVTDNKNLDLRLKEIHTSNISEMS